ncbi:hypothetical protein GCM10022254_53030 [Actinomadura meridiana]|uniref:Integral membrane protein n=1 Tax=Actinomadura meridiana TaxID=559626 RepID=A0ABP8CE82_9ACTN
MPTAPEAPEPPRGLPLPIAAMAALSAAATAMTVVRWMTDGYAVSAFVPVLAVAVVGLAALLLARRRHLLAAGMVAVLPLLADVLLISPSTMLLDESATGLSLVDERTASAWLTDLAAVTTGAALAWLIMLKAVPDVPRRVRLGVGMCPIALCGLVLAIPLKWSYAGFALVGLYFDVSPLGAAAGLTVLLSVLAGGAGAVASLRRGWTDAPPVVALMAAQFGLAVLVWALAAVAPSLRDAAYGCRPTDPAVDVATAYVSVNSNGVDVSGAVHQGIQGSLPMVAAAVAVAVLAIALVRLSGSRKGVGLTVTRVLPPLLLLGPAAVLAWDATSELRGEPLALGSSGIPNCGPGEILRVTDQSAADLVDAVAAATYTIMPLLVCLSAVTACALARRRQVRTPEPRVGTIRQ